MRTELFTFTVALVFLNSALNALAQSSGRFTIARSAVAGGGATFSTSNRFQLGSTIAQPLAAVPSSSRFDSRRLLDCSRAHDFPGNKRGNELHFRN